MDILDFFLDILLKPPQPLMGLFFFPHKPSTYRGSNLRLQLISTMAQYPDQYKVYF